MARGDFIEKRGSAVVTDSLTYVGAGGIQASIDPVTSDGIVRHYVFGGVTYADTNTAVRVPPFGQAVTTLRYSLPKAGSVVELAVFHNTARAAGHATYTVWIGTTTTGFGATINSTNTQVATATQAKDTDTFAAGKTLGVKVVSGTLTTATVSVVVGVEM